MHFKRKVFVLERGNKWCTAGLSVGPHYVPGIYINDINDSIGNESYMNKFADDVKIQRKVTTENSWSELQKDLAKLYEWQTEFNAEKCHIIKFGKSEMRPDWEYKLGNDRLLEPEKEKDQGVVVNNRLTRRAYTGESKEYTKFTS